MATPQLSPGVLVREVDLTVGRADNVLDNIGAISAPFIKGPVEQVIDVSSEQRLIDIFGKPSDIDNQYEYWMTASSFLSYGGVMKVVRADGTTLVNANSRRTRTGEASDTDTLAVTGTASTNPATANTYTFESDSAAVSNDSANGADLRFELEVANTGLVAGDYTVTILSGGNGFQIDDTFTVDLASAGITTEAASLTFDVAQIYTTGGISTVGDAALKIKNFDSYEEILDFNAKSYIFAAKDPGSWANNLKVCVIDNKADQTISVDSAFLQSNDIRVGYGVSIPLSNATVIGSGTTSSFTGQLRAIVTGVQSDAIDVKIVNRLEDGQETPVAVTYQNRTQLSSVRPGNTLNFTNLSGVAVASTTVGSTEADVVDWYDQQTLSLSNAAISWRTIASKPGTSQYAADRNALNDEIHVVVVDDTGEVTGVQGTILEKHIGLSKATDAVSAINSPQKIWWRNYLARYSSYIYLGNSPDDSSNNEEIYQTGFIGNSLVPLTLAEQYWNEDAQDKVYSAIGNATYTLLGGKDYSSDAPGESGTMKASLADLITGYNLFENSDEVAVDYLLMGPGLEVEVESQAKANRLISIANARKDCIATISPHRTNVVNLTNTENQTNNIIKFFSPLASSSYSIFDSGYKYTYDRFNNKFRYIPCNGDVAGLCVRTSILSYPWFSPAGQQRGILNNTIKLAYNPTKDQRDRLYTQRINSIINKPGVGILLFGDKTALSYASAFDRINVRRLFLTVEQALTRSAEAQLFELNDEITRASFVNIVEPYLRDIQAKRGLYGFVVICDESNNTPEVIDNNEFRADIFLKPTKSINYVTLTFVATRTGVAFDEVVGTV